MIRKSRKFKVFLLISFMLSNCFMNIVISCPPDPPDCDDPYYENECYWSIDPLLYPYNCVGCNAILITLPIYGVITCACVDWGSTGDPSSLIGSCVYTTRWTETGVKWVTACNPCICDFEPIIVSWVGKVVREGTDDEGPLYACLDDSVWLKAMPPEGFVLPPSPCEIEWSLGTHPEGANASITPWSSNPSITRASGFTKPGSYEFIAKAVGCDGYEGPGAAITVNAVLEGTEPTQEQRNQFESWFPCLKWGEWTVTGGATNSYNCIAWSVEVTDTWVWKDIVDGWPFGDEDGILETSDFDGFYSQCGYVPCSDDQADIMLYKTGSDSDPYNPEGITHAARYVPGVCAWH